MRRLLRVYGPYLRWRRFRLAEPGDPGTGRLILLAQIVGGREWSLIVLVHRNGGAPHGTYRLLSDPPTDRWLPIQVRRLAGRRQWSLATTRVRVSDVHRT